MQYRDFIHNHMINRKSQCMKIPLFLHIEITTRCNVGCPQCYCLSTEDGEDMDFSLYKVIVDQANEMSIPTILLTGGEPLLHPQLTRMIEYASQRAINVVISTSGINITESYCKQLLDAGVYEICVSLNGSNAYIHSLSRGYYENTVRALQLLSKYNINLRVNWVARKDNFRDFPNVVKLCIENNINNITILANKKQNGKMYSAMNDNDIYMLYKIYQAEKDKIHIDIDPCFNKMVNLAKVSRLPIICSAGVTFFDVMVNGEMVPCRHASFDKVYKEINISEYWNSDEIKDYRHNKKNFKITCM